MVKSVIPNALDEVLDLISKNKYRFVAGGTDMLIQHHNLKSLPIAFKDNIMYIANLKELQGITTDDDYIYIGACEPLENILESEYTPKILKDTIIEMASPAIRHTGTLGGNIGNASPAGDALVTLSLLNAVIEVRSLHETRRVTIQSFITGVRTIDLHPDEIITRIIISKTDDFDRAVFVKVGPRLSDAISKLSFAAAIKFVNGLTIDFRIAFGAVNTTVVRRPEIECQYIRLTVAELKSKIKTMQNQYSQYIKPIDDQRSNKTYRKTVSLNLLKDFIEQL